MGLKKSKKGKKKSELASGSSKSKKKVSGKSSKKTKTTTKSAKVKTLTRKDFILTEISNAGSKGVKVDSIVKRTNDKFQYGKGESSRLRVGNTLRDAENAGIVRVKNGVAFPRRG